MTIFHSLLRLQIADMYFFFIILSCLGAEKNYFFWTRATTVVIYTLKIDKLCPLTGSRSTFQHIYVLFVSAASPSTLIHKRKPS